MQKYNLTINYKCADGTEAKPTHTESLTYDSSYSVASPLITGYTADKLTVSGSMPDSDVTVDVTFTAKDYTVTYEFNGGRTVPSQAVKYNETANKPADPTKSGYTFADWYTEEKLTNKYDFAAPVTGNITLYAKWTRNYTPRPYTPPTVVIPDDNALGLTMTLVNRVLNRQPETEDDLLPNMTVWTDNANPKAWYYLAVQEATNSHYYKFKTNSQYEKWTELRETRDWAQLEK